MVGGVKVGALIAVSGLVSFGMALGVPVADWATPSIPALRTTRPIEAIISGVFAFAEGNTITFSTASAKVGEVRLPRARRSHGPRFAP